MTITTIDGSQITDTTIQDIDCDNSIEKTSNKGISSGYTPLDINSKIPIIYLPINLAQITVDFGFTSGLENNITYTNVLAPWIITNTKLICTPSGFTTIDHDPDDYAVEGLMVYPQNIVVGVGFDLVASVIEGTFGKYIINIMGI